MERFKQLNLSNIVIMHPATVSVMEKHKLDFCCTDNRTLEQALKNQPETLQQVYEELMQVVEGAKNDKPNFEKMTVTELVHYILEVHHSYVKENLITIKKHLDKLALNYAKIHPEIVKVKAFFDLLKEDFEHHLMREEEIIFPQIIELDSRGKRSRKQPSLSRLHHPFHVMEHEHERAGEIIDEIKSHCNNFTPPENACTTYKLVMAELKCFEQDLMQHAYVEDVLLFPRVIEMQRAAQSPILN